MIFTGAKLDAGLYNDLLYRSDEPLLPVPLKSQVDEAIRGLIVEPVRPSPIEKLLELKPSALERVPVRQIMARGRAGRRRTGRGPRAGPLERPGAVARGGRAGRRRGPRPALDDHRRPRGQRLADRAELRPGDPRGRPRDGAADLAGRTPSRPASGRGGSSTRATSSPTSGSRPRAAASRRRWRPAAIDDRTSGDPTPGLGDRPSPTPAGPGSTGRLGRGAARHPARPLRGEPRPARERPRADRGGRPEGDARRRSRSRSPSARGDGTDAFSATGREIWHELAWGLARPPDPRTDPGVLGGPIPMSRRLLDTLAEAHEPDLADHSWGSSRRRRAQRPAAGTTRLELTALPSGGDGPRVDRWRRSSRSWSCSGGSTAARGRELSRPRRALLVGAAGARPAGGRRHAGRAGPGLVAPRDDPVAPADHRRRLGEHEVLRPVHRRDPTAAEIAAALKLQGRGRQVARRPAPGDAAAGPGQGRRSARTSTRSAGAATCSSTTWSRPRRPGTAGPARTRNARRDQAQAVRLAARRRAPGRPGGAPGPAGRGDRPGHRRPLERRRRPAPRRRGGRPARTSRSSRSPPGPRKARATSGSPRSRPARSSSPATR